MKTEDNSRILFLALLLLGTALIPLLSSAGGYQLPMLKSDEVNEWEAVGLLLEPQKCFGSESLVKAEAGYLTDNPLDSRDYFDFVDNDNIKDFLAVQKAVKPDAKCL